MDFIIGDVVGFSGDGMGLPDAGAGPLVEGGAGLITEGVGVSWWESDETGGAGFLPKDLGWSGCGCGWVGCAWVGGWGCGGCTGCG